MKSTTAIVKKALILTAATALLILVTWFVIDFTMSGIHAWMMRFESEPPEGRTYWRLQALKRGLPGNAIVAIVLLTIAYYPTREWVRLFTRR